MSSVERVTIFSHCLNNPRLDAAARAAALDRLLEFGGDANPRIRQAVLGATGRFLLSGLATEAQRDRIVANTIAHLNDPQIPVRILAQDSVGKFRDNRLLTLRQGKEIFQALFMAA